MGQMVIEGEVHNWSSVEESIFAEGRTAIVVGDEKGSARRNVFRATQEPNYEEIAPTPTLAASDEKRGYETQHKKLVDKPGEAKLQRDQKVKGGGETETPASYGAAGIGIHE
ncbi:hypothetical protein Bca101_010370 [Brassica carinata]